MSNVYNSVMEEVTSAIATQSSTVREMVVSKLVQRELEKRAENLDKALQKRKELFVDLRKVEKPDVEHFDAEGKSCGGVFTKERRDAIATAKQKLVKLDDAITQAIVSNVWDKLAEMTK